jgi:hypothetical protein
MSHLFFQPVHIIVGLSFGQILLKKVVESFAYIRLATLLANVGLKLATLRRNKIIAQSFSPFSAQDG